MHHTAPLNRLPVGVQFPTQLLGKISYDPIAKELRFRGFMSKGDFDCLARMSNEVEYLKALEHLFQVCEFTTEQPRPQTPWLTIGFATALLMVLGVGFGTWRHFSSSAKATPNPSAKFDTPAIRR